MRVTLVDAGITLTVPAGTRILDVAPLPGLRGPGDCREAECCRCLVEVVSGMENLTPPSLREKELLRVLRAGPNDRLACQTAAEGDTAVRPVPID